MMFVKNSDIVAVDNFTNFFGSKYAGFRFLDNCTDPFSVTLLSLGSHVSDPIVVAELQQPMANGPSHLLDRLYYARLRTSVQLVVMDLCRPHSNNSLWDACCTSHTTCYDNFFFNSFHKISYEMADMMS